MSCFQIPGWEFELVLMSVCVFSGSVRSSLVWHSRHGWRGHRMFSGAELCHHRGRRPSRSIHRGAWDRYRQAHTRIIHVHAQTPRWHHFLCVCVGHLLGLSHDDSKFCEERFGSTEDKRLMSSILTSIDASKPWSRCTSATITDFFDDGNGEKWLWRNLMLLFSKMKFKYLMVIKPIISIWKSEYFYYCYYWFLKYHVE